MRLKKIICSIVIVMMMVTANVRANSYTDYIDSIMDTWTEMDESCDSAPKQQVNGAYRTVELLGAIALELDKKGAYKSFVLDVIDTYEDRMLRVIALQSNW